MVFCGMSAGKPTVLSVHHSPERPGRSSEAGHSSSAVDTVEFRRRDKARARNSDCTCTARSCTTRITPAELDSTTRTCICCCRHRRLRLSMEPACPSSVGSCNQMRIFFALDIL